MTPHESYSSAISSALTHVDSWPVDDVSTACIHRSQTYSFGDTNRVFELASITKLVVAYAFLIALEEEAVSLDDTVTEHGATLAHVLSHASGVAFDTPHMVAPVGQKRMYSSAGFEIAAQHLWNSTGISCADYVREAVCEPLGMKNTELYGSAGHAMRSTVADLSLLAQELLNPVLISRHTLQMATSVQYPGLRGIVPGYGNYKNCDWGLGCEIKGSKVRHWTGERNSPNTFGHFGQAGTFLWVDPACGTALIALTNRPFGEWAIRLWSEYSDSILASTSPLL